MISYEASIICDVCRQGIAGPVMPNPEIAGLSAIARAVGHGWTQHGLTKPTERHLCPLCTYNRAKAAEDKIGGGK